MNQKGEATLLGIASLVALSGLLLLCSLELKRSYRLLEKRTHLFLCVKESKEELHQYLELMGRTNWAIKNLERTKWVMMFIPGLQGAAANTEEAKKFLIQYQNLHLLLYLKTLTKLKAKDCLLDPRMLQTPFELGTTGYKRQADSSTQTRSRKWTYYYISTPYRIELKIELQDLESVSPKIKYFSKENAVRSFFPLSFAY